MDGSAWQNHQQPHDVSGDGKITPLDVLLVINYINAGHPVARDASPARAKPPPPFYDVNGDGKITPEDVLIVINYLNEASGTSGGGEPASGGGAEGERPTPQL